VAARDNPEVAREGRKGMTQKRKPTEAVYRALDLEGIPFPAEAFWGSARYGWTEEFRDGCYDEAPTYRTGKGELADLGVGPGRITLIGGVPKVGKTDLVNQVSLDAVREDPSLVALICNTEMGWPALQRRMISRLSGIPAEILIGERWDEHIAARVRQAECEMKEIAQDVEEKTQGWGSRLVFGEPPCNLVNAACHLENLLSSSERQTGQTIVVLDFVQCFKTVNRTALAAWRRAWDRDEIDTPPPLTSDLSQVMSDVRAMARTGLAFIVVSRLNRQGYEDAALGGFHGSGELEYQCDNAFILTRDEARPGVVNLRHVASRDSEPRDRFLRFDGRIHRFTPLDEGEGSE
jgi:hypothetical protein